MSGCFVVAMGTVCPASHFEAEGWDAAGRVLTCAGCVGLAHAVSLLERVSLSLQFSACTRRASRSSFCPGEVYSLLTAFQVRERTEKRAYEWKLRFTKGSHFDVSFFIA